MLNWIPVAVCMGLIFYLSSVPNPTSFMPILAFPQGDKLGHIAAYAILTSVCFLAFRRCHDLWIASHATLITSLAVSGFGLFCEWYQMSLPFRSTDVWDIASNGMGSWLALAGVRSPSHTLATAVDEKTSLLREAIG